MNSSAETKSKTLRWCKTHDGFPPIQNVKAYRCENCGKTACAMDFFETEKGKRCGNCLAELPFSEKTEKCKEQFELAKARAQIAKTTILFSEVFFLQSTSLLFVNPQMKTGILNAGVAFYMVLVGFIMLTIAGTAMLFMSHVRRYRFKIR